MDQNLQTLLEENLAVSKESLAILKKMHRNAVLHQVFGFIKWLLIVGLTVYGLLQLYPYVIQMQNTVNNLQNNPSFENFGSTYFAE